MPSINLHFEDIKPILINKGALNKWINDTINSERRKINKINIIFSRDEYILLLNQQYLNHDYYTDVITFDYSNNTRYILGDIFISYDRVKENAQTRNINFIDELHRIIIHGILHLLGFNDKSKQSQSLMIEKENTYLSLRESEMFHVKHDD